MFVNSFSRWNYNFGDIIAVALQKICKGKPGSVLQKL